MNNARDFNRRWRAFSLIELVVVLVIIGVISAIAVPRLVHASTRARMAKLTQDYEIMQGAVELYTTEHLGAPPTLASFVAQITQYTDLGGDVSAVKSPATGHVYGPYLRRIPTIALGPHAGERAVGSSNAPGTGWLYWESWGFIMPNIWDEQNDVPGDLEAIIADWYAYVGYEP